MPPEAIPPEPGPDSLQLDTVKNNSWTSIRNFLAKPKHALHSINRRIASKVKLGNWSPPQWSVFGTEVTLVVSLGFTMIQVAEYAVAIAFWLILICVWFLIAIGKVAEATPRARWNYLNVTCAIGAGVLLITWTNVKRGDQPWTSFIHMEPQKTVPPSPAVLTALYIGCGFNRIPIALPNGTSIHVMWLDPAILRGSPNIPYAGPFEDISAPFNGKPLIWPSDRDGKWLKGDDMVKLAKSMNFVPTPYAFQCSLKNYSITLDEITLQLIIDTTDRRRHVYNVPFNPSVVGQPFDFYMVNKCTFGAAPIMVQWGEVATVRVLGEEQRRNIPLKFDRKSWPSNLAMMGPSLFVWNDRKDGCKWDEK